jgi:2-dehydro-3-deoxyphosphogluconate aldolase/(4S)-4-hydroxy-2-oxoglutarate aldolase
MVAVPSPLQTLDATRVLPAVAAQDPTTLHAWADACLDAGIPALELFLRGAGAEPAVIAAIRSLATSHPGLAVGAGSVYDAETALRMIDAGARIIVSPITDVSTGERCRAAGIDWLPGAFTPTEIALAERAGATHVKLFPARAIDAPAFLRSHLAPSPASRIIPTNVALEEIAPLIAAGATGVGLGDRVLGGADPRDERAVAARLRAAREAAGAPA